MCARLFGNVHGKVLCRCFVPGTSADVSIGIVKSHNGPRAMFKIMKWVPIVLPS